MANSNLSILLENQSVKQMMDMNDIATKEMVASFLPKFHLDIKSYVLEHTDEFIGDSIEEIYENIKDFTVDCLISIFHEIDTYYDGE